MDTIICVWVHFSQKPGSLYVHPKAEFVRLDGESEAISNPPDADESGLAGFSLEAQGHWPEASSTGDCKPEIYAWGLKCNREICRASEAATVLRIFQTVERGMERLRKSFGPPASFPQYVTWVCQTLGVKSAAHPTGPLTSWWADQQKRLCSVPEAAAYLERQISLWQEAAVKKIAA